MVLTFLSVEKCLRSHQSAAIIRVNNSSEILFMKHQTGWWVVSFQLMIFQISSLDLEVSGLGFVFLKQSRSQSSNQVFVYVRSWQTTASCSIPASLFVQPASTSQFLTHQASL